MSLSLFESQNSCLRCWIHLIHICQTIHLLQLLQIRPICDKMPISEVPMFLFKISKEEKIESNKVLKKDIAKLPPNMAKLLKKLLGDTANDSEIKVDDTASEYLTPNEAASYLQVSRPYVMKLIADKVLYAHKVGAHNKVHLKDVTALKNSWNNQNTDKSERIKKGVDRFIQDEGWDD